MTNLNVIFFILKIFYKISKNTLDFTLSKIHICVSTYERSKNNAHRKIGEIRAKRPSLGDSIK